MCYICTMKHKHHIEQYRNIKGKHYICYTSNPSYFNEVKIEAKSLWLSVRIINGQLYREVKSC